MIEIKNIVDNVSELKAALEKEVEGDVLFHSSDRALYATDASNYRRVPVGVVRPRSMDQVPGLVAVARRFGVPLLNRGGGTSLAGQCCNTALIVDYSRYCNHVLDIDLKSRTATLEPGVALDTLREKIQKDGFTFGPDPATHKWCTLGGMLGNNSCGVHSLMSGRTADNVREMEVLLYDGTILTVGPTDARKLQEKCSAEGREGGIYRDLRALAEKYGKLIKERFPDIPRRVSGYNLDELLPHKNFNVARALVGSEGTCVTILRATLDLVPYPPHRALAVIGYRNVYEAADHVEEIEKYDPIGLEGLDDNLIRYMKERHLHEEDVDLLPEGRGWLVVEFAGDSREEAKENARRAVEELRKGSDSPIQDVRVFDDPEKQDTIWEIRESGLGATAKVPSMDDTHPGWEDAAVPPGKEGAYLRDFRELLDRYGYSAALYGHFGQGCIHCRIDFDLRTAHGIERYREFIDEASDLVLSYNGSFSGEHGDGVARGPLLEKMYGKELVGAFHEFKRIWDPDGKMNPGKVVEAESITDNLRMGTDYAPPKVDTYFAFPQDGGSFAEATTRCVGVGRCRKDDTGVMCPSYMVTRDEKHTTRGRAHLLWEMFNKDLVGDFSDSQVEEALDLCLACKGCKRECPVQVDMATYKAEFLAHYYKKHLRPRSAYAFGGIMYWARLASIAPSLVNLVTQTPGLSHLARLAAGVSQQRSIPKFAPQTFSSWFKERPPSQVDGPEVLLWPDTFNDNFHPEVLKAGVEVLERAGRRVILPERWLCCGRPLYDYGFLGIARSFLSKIIDTLRPKIRQGVAVVGLEPSCTAVFRDELKNFFPQDQDALRLARQTYTLSEFLYEYLDNYEPPRRRGKALLHLHCHHRAVMEFRSEVRLLKATGLDVEELDSGCCGMAGAFGFEAEKRDISVEIGERVLLPAVRNASPQTLVVANGFSCREQIRQQSERHALHLAQVLASSD